MSYQIKNKLIFKNRSFHIVSFTNEGLIKPQDFGITPRYQSSIRMRGYTTTYVINSQTKLILKDLYVNTDMNEGIKFINGIPPQPSSKTNISSKTTYREYKNLNLAVDYSGYILIGDNAIRELNTKFSNPATYEEVIELEFKNGVLTTAQDLSNRMSEYRLFFKDGDLEIDNQNIEIDAGLKKWF